MEPPGFFLLNPCMGFFFATRLFVWYQQTSYVGRTKLSLPAEGGCVPEEASLSPASHTATLVSQCQNWRNINNWWGSVRELRQFEKKKNLRNLNVCFLLVLMWLLCRVLKPY